MKRRAQPRRASAEALAAVYDRATRGSSGRQPVANLFDATGDPLAIGAPEAAAFTYGLHSAPRPNVALRHLFDATFGGPPDDAVSLALQLRADRAVWRELGGPLPLTVARSDLAAAEMAVALMAVRGTWLGASAPVPFGEAVDRVRKAMRKPALRIADGSTGNLMTIRPATGAMVPMPDRPGTYLPSAGAVVADNAYWRRRLADGDAVFAD